MGKSKCLQFFQRSPFTVWVDETCLSSIFLIVPCNSGLKQMTCPLAQVEMPPVLHRVHDSRYLLNKMMVVSGDRSESKKGCAFLLLITVLIQADSAPHIYNSTLIIFHSQGTWLYKQWRHHVVDVPGHPVPVAVGAWSLLGRLLPPSSSCLSNLPHAFINLNPRECGAA